MIDMQGVEPISANPSPYLPIYRAVAEQIARRIDSSVWPAGTILPAEVALAQEFQVSVGTIRRALSELTAEGALARRRKTGTVVTGRTPHHSLRFFYNYFRLHSRNGELQNSVSRVLRLTLRPATADERRQLALAPSAQVQEVHRLRIVADRPVMHERVVLPAQTVPGFPSNPAEVPDLIYKELWQRYSIKISAIREQVEAELATAEDCRLLNLTAPAAVLVLREIAYDEMAQPVLLNNHRASTREDVYINEIQ